LPIADCRLAALGDLLFKFRENKSTAKLTEGNEANEGGGAGQALWVDDGFLGLRYLRYLLFKFWGPKARQN
jgi:hypothetical protein